MTRRFDTPCTIEIEHSADYLHAHVTLDGDLAIGPGDRVRVHGNPVRVAFGQTLRERRIATIERAGWARRTWTKFAARFELSELYEVSFSPRTTL